MKRLVLLVALLTCLLCAPPLLAAPQNRTIRFTAIKKVPYLYLQDVAAFYGMACTVSGKNITLRSRYSTILLTKDSRIMSLNGVQVHLSRPITQIGVNYFIGKSDFSLILEPILRVNSIPRHTVKTIVIDPGHGGKDVGAVGANKKIYEKNINLQVAMRLATKLKAKGFTVYVTRNKDTDVSLETRVQMTNKVKPDVFISLHCNSASSSSAGLEIYIATPFGDPPTGDNYVSKEKCPANLFDRENGFLSFYTQRAILQRTGAQDRGVRKRRFYVVRNIAAPSMLVEMGFISNNSELNALCTPARQDKIADAIADAVAKYKIATQPPRL